MKYNAFILTLILTLSIMGCAKIMNEVYDESSNVAAILSPNGNQVAFIRCFYYYSEGPGIFQDTMTNLYARSFLYIMDLPTKKLKKLVDLGEPYRSDVRFTMDYYNISWENNFIAYTRCESDRKIYIIDTNSTYYKYSVPYYGTFTLSSDGQGIFYFAELIPEDMTTTEVLKNKHNYALRYVNLNENSKSFEIVLPTIPNLTMLN